MFLFSFYYGNTSMLSKNVHHGSYINWEWLLGGFLSINQSNWCMAIGEKNLDTQKLQMSVHFCGTFSAVVWSAAFTSCNTCFC